MTEPEQPPQGGATDAAGQQPAADASRPPAVPDPPESPEGPTEIDTETPGAEGGTGPDGSGDEGAPDWEALAAEDPRSRAELLAELNAAEDERDEYLDALQRTRAEFDNYRKRMMRESNRQREAGKAEVAEALVDVLDDFDRTLEATAGGPAEGAADGSQEATGVEHQPAGADDGLARGIELVHGNLVDALTSVGLSRIDETGVPFDPNRHEAVQRRDADDGAEPDEPVVVEVFRPGYEMSGRVVRAAMVVVEQ